MLIPLAIPRSLIGAVFALSLGPILLAAKPVVALNPLSGYSGNGDPIVSDVMLAELSVSPDVTVVDRESLQAVLREMQLSEQGMVSTSSLGELGRLVGADYFCSGKVSQKDGIVMVRVVDVRTSVMKLAYARTDDEVDPVQVGQSIAADVLKLINGLEATEDEPVPASGAPEIPENWGRPVVMVSIPEEHLGVEIIDPAAETELMKRLLAENFVVKQLDSPVDGGPSRSELLEIAKDKGVEVLLVGEGISELGARIGSFEGCRARVELQAIEVSSGNVILSESAYGGATDLSESVAGKKALQAAANRLADEMLYPLAEIYSE